MNKVSINAAQQRYVIECGEGYTCLGFANARDHANQIASKLSRANLAFTDEDYATLAGYDKYLKAIQAWSQSPLTRTTYFDPGTDSKAARVLESCRTHERKVRLILGDTSTGEPWLEEHDVIGRIGRSTGSLKVPLADRARRAWRLRHSVRLPPCHRGLGIGRLPVSPCRLPRSRLEHQAFGRRRPVLERSAARRSRRQFP